MSQYFHSVTLDKDKCKGCTNCIKRCPTEAIRVQNGKAKIIKERCIDCGECIRICPYHAKKAITDPFEKIFEYKYKIALPAPTLYGQFNNTSDINTILTGLIKLEFDAVFEVARAAEIVSLASKKYIQTANIDTPAISSACPAVIRLIGVRFPNLIKNILPIQSPMEVAARIAKKETSEKMGLDFKEIGVFFISPCAAKVTSTKSPVGIKGSFVDGVISLKEIYLKLAPMIHKINQPMNLATAGMKGIIWANTGGEAMAVGKENCIAVDGIHNVIQVLEAMEDEKLQDIEYAELLSCTGGCVGGPLVVENNFVAKARIKQIALKNCREDNEKNNDYLDKIDVLWDHPITYKPIMKLDNNMVEAMKKMEMLDNIYKQLPGLDCGSCGSPSCKTLAEDIVRGFANETDCIFKLREKVRILAKEMIDLESKMPPSFQKE